MGLSGEAVAWTGTGLGVWGSGQGIGRMEGGGARK